MKQELKAHWKAYLSLALALGIFAVVFFLYHYEKHVQQAAIVGIVLYYSLWGIITHTKATHITFKLAFEYISVAILGGTILFLLTI